MPDSRLVHLSLAEAAREIRRGSLSPVELAEAVLARIDDLNPRLNAFTTLVPREEALAGVEERLGLTRSPGSVLRVSTIRARAPAIAST